jgi:GTP cyclohydrolase II
VKIVSFPARPAISGRIRRVSDDMESRSDDGSSPEALEALARRLQKPAEISLDGRIVVEARTELPTEHGTFDVRLFRFAGGSEEHLAISCGELTGDEPLPIRIHSECFTGEVLSSVRCECANQLDFALQTFQSLGRGLVIYLRQEGRGIGLANKLRAYALQARGADTVDANRLLGLPDDARQYDAAAALLRHLDVKSVRLMTNNPSKVRALEQLSISVADRMPSLVATNSMAAHYLQTKRDRMDHHVPAQLTLAKPVRR